jgi:hypothetical protein
MKRDTIKTALAIENLERVGNELGYTPKRYYSMKNLGVDLNGHKHRHIDLAYLNVKL